MAKRFIVIGLGIFGEGIAETLYQQGNEVIALDINEEKINRISPRVTKAIVGDGRSMDILDKAGARDADAAVVSTGDDISASILAVMALRDIGAPDIYVKVISHDHARILRKIGVTETVFPERESSQNLAQRLVHGEALLNYIHLSGDFSIQEMAVPNAWKGKSLRELQLRMKHNVSVIAVRDVLTDQLVAVPDPDAPLKDSDTLLVAGNGANLTRIARID
ncbi:MAG: TrkA family potassium uptake protein [Rhodothermales bacterium]